MKLIKINTDHYIIVDDSEIKEGDWMFENNKSIGQASKITQPSVDANYTDYSAKKISHSTQPFNCNCSNRGYKLDTNCAERNHCFGKVQYLPVQEIKELIGEVDVVKKAEKYHWKTDYQGAFISGYNQALEDNKDRKYTEEDMELLAAELIGKYRLGQIKEAEDVYKIINSYRVPKTEWEVKIVDGKFKLKSFI